jgi:hypothetical protein
MPWLGEWMVQNRISQAPLVVRSGKCEEGRFAACELKYRRARHERYSAISGRAVSQSLLSIMKNHGR